MSTTSKEQNAPRRGFPRPPTPFARKLVRYIIGFGVGVAVGLAPYLGILRVPLFTPLLNLIPNSIQDTTIPLSAALMGMVAVVVQWYGGERITRKWLRRLFGRILTVAGVAFLTLIIVHTSVVVAVPILGGEDEITVVVGFTRPLKPPCTEGVSDLECIQRLTLDPSAISSFWGDRQIRLARLALLLSYLLFTSSFGALIGVLLLREPIQSR